MDRLVKQMNEEVRKMQIKNVLRTYFIINNANSFDVETYGKPKNGSYERVSFNADSACEALLGSLMTEEEYYHFMDCNEFHGEHWVDMVEDYLELKEAIEEEAKEEQIKLAKDVAAKEGLRDVTKVFEHWEDGVCGWCLYGTMHGLDPETYENGCSPMVVRVVNGKIDLVDGV